MQPVERKPTVEELYADLDHANLMRRQASRTEDIVRWRNEVGRLTDEIRRAQMPAKNTP